MPNTFTKLVALGTAVASIGAVTFNFTGYDSKDSLIKQGVDNLKAIVQGKDEALAKLQAEYNSLLTQFDSVNGSLTDAKSKLEAIYKKVTGNDWDEASNGSILDYDFNSLIKDGNQWENNANGDAIGEILGLDPGCSTQQIIVAIQNLQNEIANLSQQVTNLQAEIKSLQAEIATYKQEESALVLDLQEQIAQLKAKAENEANAIIDEANTEEQAQLDYINNTLTELGGEAVKEEVPEEDKGEVEEGNNIVLSGDWSQATEEQKTALLNMFDELGIEDIEVTPGIINASISYLEVKVPQEAYNVMVAHEQYRPTTESIYLDSEGNIANKDVAAPDGKTANGYTQVRIAQQ